MFIFGFCGSSTAEESTSPTVIEIQGLLSDTRTAWQELRPLLVRQRTLLVESGAESPKRDVLVTYALDVAVPMLRNQPQRFNGPDGFLLIEWLFDASRGGALCANTASTQARQLVTAGKTDLANQFDELGKGCSDSSATLYKLAEKAGVLYFRYLRAH